MITMDKNMPFQRNLSISKLKVLVLDAPSNTMAAVLPFANHILQSLETAPSGQFVFLRLPS